MGAKMSWQFYNPVRIHLGRGCRQQLTEKLQGSNVLVVTSQRGRHQLSNDNYLKKLLTANRIIWLDEIKENPDLADLQQQIYFLKNKNIQVIIAFGGGSAIDAAKAIRLGLAIDGKYLLEKLIKQPELHQQATQLPLYTLPTTSGTGSEVTPFATVWNHATKQKLSLSSDVIYPTEAYVDAALTDSLPSHVTLSTGLDAINQAAESIWNKNASSLTLAYAIRSLKLSLPALPKLVEGEGSEQDRNDLAEASLLAGLAISQTRTALCHSISYPLTAHFGIPHGLACAFTMPAVCELNLKADDGRFKQVTIELFNSKDTNLFIQALEQLNQRLGVTNHVKSKVTSLASVLQLKDQMLTVGRSDNNLVTDIDLDKVLSKSWYMKP